MLINEYMSKEKIFKRNNVNNGLVEQNLEINLILILKIHWF